MDNSLPVGSANRGMLVRRTASLMGSDETVRGTASEIAPTTGQEGERRSRPEDPELPPLALARRVDLESEQDDHDRRAAAKSHPLGRIQRRAGDTDQVPRGGIED